MPEKFFINSSTILLIIKEYYIFIRDFFKALFEDKISYYSASLSFYTLFAIIPLLIIILSIITYLPNFEDIYSHIQSMIFENLMPSNSKEILIYINGFVKNAGQLGFIGLGYVLFASLMFFKNYDFIVNDIFQSKQRSFWESLSIYWTLLTLTPILMVLSFYLSSKIQAYLDKNSVTSAIHLLSILPYFIVLILFFLAYKISPNVRLSTGATLLSAFIASSVWYIAKSAFVFYVMHNQTYLSIYGSLSILLFFFFWIYISWAIFLHGMKFCELLNKEKSS